MCVRACAGAVHIIKSLMFSALLEARTLLLPCTNMYVCGAGGSVRDSKVNVMLFDCVCDSAHMCVLCDVAAAALVTECGSVTNTHRAPHWCVGGSVTHTMLFFSYNTHTRYYSGFLFVGLRREFKHISSARK